MDRVFRMEERAYFVWSPNSSRVPHFPGAHARDCRIGSNYIPPPSERRVDGHLGPKDPTRNPQPYQENEPWLAFVRRQDPYELIDIDVAYVKVYDVWKTHALDGLYGYLCPRFIQFLSDEHRDQDKEIARLSSRPIRSGIRSWANWAKYVPFDEDFKNLGVITRFDNAVDLVTKIQRLLLEKRAWCAMVDSYPYTDQQWTSQDRLIQQLAKKPVVPADDQFIGVWINGQAAPLDVLWFLTAARIPCFVLQEVTENPTPSQMRKSPVAGTEIEGDVQRALYDKKAQMPPKHTLDKNRKRLEKPDQKETILATHPMNVRARDVFWLNGLRAKSKFHVLPTLFYTKLETGGYAAVKKFSWASFPLKEKELLVVPIHQGSIDHWLLAVVYLDRRKDTNIPLISDLDTKGDIQRAYIFCMNSLSRDDSQILGKLGKFLKQASKEQGIALLNPNIHKKALDVPQQANKYDCGLFMLHFARSILEFPLYFLECFISGSNPIWHEGEVCDLRAQLLSRISDLADVYAEGRSHQSSEEQFAPEVEADSGCEITGEVIVVSDSDSEVEVVSDSRVSITPARVPARRGARPRDPGPAVDVMSALNAAFGGNERTGRLDPEAVDAVRSPSPHPPPTTAMEIDENAPTIELSNLSLDLPSIHPVVSANRRPHRSPLNKRSHVPPNKRPHASKPIEMCGDCQMRQDQTARRVSKYVPALDDATILDLEQRLDTRGGSWSLDETFNVPVCDHEHPEEEAVCESYLRHLKAAELGLLSDAALQAHERQLEQAKADPFRSMILTDDMVLASAEIETSAVSEVAPDSDLIEHMRQLRLLQGARGRLVMNGFLHTDPAARSRIQGAKLALKTTLESKIDQRKKLRTQLTALEADIVHVQREVEDKQQSLADLDAERRRKHPHGAVTAVATRNSVETASAVIPPMSNTAGPSTPHPSFPTPAELSPSALARLSQSNLSCLWNKLKQMKAPGYDQPPIVFARWLQVQGLKQMKGVPLSPELSVDLRDVRGRNLLMVMVPVGRKEHKHSLFALLTVIAKPGTYGESFERFHVQVARTHLPIPEILHCQTPPTDEEVVRFLARQGVTMAQANDAWSFAIKFLRDESKTASMFGTDFVTALLEEAERTATREGPPAALYPAYQDVLPAVAQACTRSPTCSQRP
ncbi:hypothetical protein C8R46DRAFT_1221949 [Mycena filopes]|nr:hypothetical protein C8R46DRAFT_1221949 [Mycena filopes]